MKKISQSTVNDILGTVAFLLTLGLAIILAIFIRKH
jgi:hypothetical protein